MPTVSILTINPVIPWGKESHSGCHALVFVSMGVPDKSMPTKTKAWHPIWESLSQTNDTSSTAAEAAESDRIANERSPGKETRS
ncbi:hypothetical protein ACYFX5_13120 [Bremerella sp. T1]|uniref:hypothetical protein n=1 Tax=Bremerella sp. TYQ1 TaxID=3119568 RepID=UPI001CCD9704|nr:hypothetical protein [Bremerella volcania]UBM34001.1 hypothetical protein LA756_15065 [Bremerella volcania]